MRQMKQAMEHAILAMLRENARIMGVPPPAAYRIDDPIMPKGGDSMSLYERTEEPTWER